MGMGGAAMMKVWNVFGRLFNNLLSTEASLREAGKEM